MMAGWHHWTRWTWVWVNSGSWWWTGRPGVLRFMGLQRVGHNWATELNWTEWWMMLSNILCASLPTIYFFGKMSVLSIFLLGCFFFCWILRVLYIFWIQSFIRYVICKYILQVRGSSFQSLNSVFQRAKANFNSQIFHFFL